HRRPAVGVGTPLAQSRALAESGVDDHSVDTAKGLGQLMKDGEDGVVVGDVQGTQLHRAFGVGSDDRATQRLHLLPAPCAKPQVIAESGELVRHLRPKTGTGAGDDDLSLAHVVLRLFFPGSCCYFASSEPMTHPSSCTWQGGHTLCTELLLESEEVEGHSRSA